MADNFESLKEVIVDTLSVDAAKVTPEARFKEDLDADSLDLVEFIMGLEEKFDITIEDEESAEVTTVGQALELVSAKQAQ